MESKITPLTGLWKQKSKNGAEYLSGTLGIANVLVFRNEQKRPGSNDPDWRLCLAPKEKPRENLQEQIRRDDIPF